MARFVAHRSGRTSPKRKSLWIDFANIATSETSIPAGSALLIGSLNAAALATRPFTVVRTRGRIWTATDQQGGSEDAFGALGFAIVSDQASAIGVTAVPTPITDAGSSLFFSWTAWFACVEGAATPDAAPGFVADFDSKAMRKVEVGEDLIISIENGNSADGANFIMMGRILIKTN